ncbi:hypothetical protein LB536_22550 [Mesorhizobium sp. ES1-3]|nr:hypothetical protein [Mesorhizobium sp. ES1-3]
MAVADHGDFVLGTPQTDTIPAKRSTTYMRPGPSLGTEDLCHCGQTGGVRRITDGELIVIDRETNPSPRLRVGWRHTRLASDRYADKVATARLSVGTAAPMPPDGCLFELWRKVFYRDARILEPPPSIDPANEFFSFHPRGWPGMLWPKGYKDLPSLADDRSCPSYPPLRLGWIPRWIQNCHRLLNLQRHFSDVGYDVFPDVLKRLPINQDRILRS